MTTSTNVDVIRLWQLPDDFFALDLDAQWRAIKAVTGPATPLPAPRRPCPLTLRDEVLKDVRSNIGVSYAYYDEGAYRNELKNGDLRVAPEALRVVNLGRDPYLPVLSEVELGRYYGSLDDRTLRVIHNERVLHPFQPYIIEATANQIEYFEKVFGLDTGLSSRDQVWYWKELLGAASLIAALVALIPLSRILLQAPYFQPLMKPAPPPLPSRLRERSAFSPAAVWVRRR